MSFPYVTDLVNAVFGTQWHLAFRIGRESISQAVPKADDARMKYLPLRTPVDFQKRFATGK